MKLAVVAVTCACACGSTMAFVLPAANGSARRSCRSSFSLQEKQKGEQMDLNLDDMFDMFDKADKTVKDPKPSAKKDTKTAGNDIGDMLSSLFGGKKK